MTRRRARIEDFTVGWICALHVELTAAREALDEEYECIDSAAHYILGRIGKHNVAVACLPAGQLGTSSAAAVAVHMRNTFPALQYGLMVGIAGGVPGKSADIRLGDVVISHPQGRYGGVVQYDFGKTGSGGQQFPNGSLNSPNSTLLQAVAHMRSSIDIGRSHISSYLSALNKRNLFPRPGQATDILFDATYDHVVGETCDECLKDKILYRIPRTSEDIVVHYGTVASGNQVVKDGFTRDRMSARHGGVVCFEMEAAGLMNIFPCLVVRGVCDYADSHKNKAWQSFAAAAAAATAKEVLSFVPTVLRASDDRTRAQSHIGISNALDDESDAPKTDELRYPTASRGSTAKHKIDPSSLYTKSDHTIEDRYFYQESLRFTEMDARHATIQDAHSETCLWLLARPEYQDWLASNKLSEHHGFFWIKGNPGTGKSTIMKFVMASTKRKMADTVVIKFFFNARGSALEKTVLGMYRSLLFQLLDNLTYLQHVFALLLPSRRPDQHGREPKPHVWDVEILQTLYGHAVQRLDDRCLICFIDALDECEEDQVREMVAFFEHLGDIAASAGLSFRTCFSSRHYPHITIDHGISLVLEDQEGHKNDVVKYVNSKMRGIHSRLIQDIKREICERSSGIFLWVVLVVHILKKDFARGQIQAVKKRLREIPDGLDKLFDDILTRDTNDTESLVLCLQWILFAERPLTLEELFYAVVVGVDPASIVSLDPRDIDREALGNFILNASKGLAELTNTEPKSVQFIHESVREYLLKPTSLQKIRADLAINFAGTSQERLKKFCEQQLTQLSIPLCHRLEVRRKKPHETWYLPQQRSLPFRVHRNRIHLPKHSTSLGNDFPFLQYATDNVFFHADAAARHGMNQEGFVEDFPYRKWITLNNEFASDFWQKFVSSDSPLYIFTCKGAPNLIRIEAQKGRHVDIRGGMYRYPLLAAMAFQNEETLSALLGAESKITAGEGFSQDDASCATFLPVVELLLKYTASQVAVEQTPLSLAADMGDTKVVRLLLETGRVDVESKCGLLGGTPLLRAAWSGHEAVVKLLLEKGKAEIEAPDSFGRTAVSWAAAKGHLRVLKLLLVAWQRQMRSRQKTLDTRRLGLNGKDWFGNTPLHDAVSGCAIEVIKILVSIDEVDLEAVNNENKTPLQLALGRDGYEIKALLLAAPRVRARRASGAAVKNKAKSNAPDSRPQQNRESRDPYRLRRMVGREPRAPTPPPFLLSLGRRVAPSLRFQYH